MPKKTEVSRYASGLQAGFWNAVAAMALGATEGGSREVSTGLRVGADRGNTVAATEGGGDVLTWQPALHILYTQTRLDQAHIHISQVLNNSKFVG